MAHIRMQLFERDLRKHGIAKGDIMISAEVQDFADIARVLARELGISVEHIGHHMLKLADPSGQPIPDRPGVAALGSAS